LDGREAVEEVVSAEARGLHALPQRLVLLLQVRHTAASLEIELGPARTAAARATLLQVGFGLEGARAPARQLLRYVAEDRLELVEHLSITSLSVVRQARPPAPPAHGPAPPPPPPPAA